MECFLISEGFSESKIIETKSGLSILKVRINPDKFIDFDGFNKIILKYSDTKPLLFLEDNYDLSPTLLLAHMMNQENRSLTMVSFKLFALIGKAECHRKCYNQLMNYNPGQVIKV